MSTEGEFVLIKKMLLVIWLLILISTSFGIGYLFGREKSPAPIIIEKATDDK